MSLSLAQRRLIAFVARFADCPMPDPVDEGRFALAMSGVGRAFGLPVEVFDVALFETLNGALASAADNVEEGWTPEQILDTETGDVYSARVHVDVTADVDPDCRIEVKP